MSATKRSVSGIAVIGAVLLAASCGGKSQDLSSEAGTGGDSSGEGDGDVGDGDGDGDVPSGGGTGGRTDGAGGDAPDGGSSSGGGGTPMGGATSTGGAASAGGDTATGGAGTGGAGGTVTTATLGDPCGSPGAFACAESNSQLALICGGDGEWEFRETCAGDALCDSYEGSGLGTCRVPLPECEVVTGAFCDDEGRVAECAESGLETVVVEECGNGYGCLSGSCAQIDDECPTVGVLHNCSGDDCTSQKPAWCNESEECDNSYWGYAVLAGDTTTVVRLPNDGLCSRGECATPAYQLVLPQSEAFPDMAMRFTVGPGWGMVAHGNGSSDVCGPRAEGCVIIPARTPETISRGVYMIPLSDDPVIRNVTIEPVPPGTTCD